MRKTLSRRRVLMMLGAGSLVSACAATIGPTPSANDCVTFQMGDRTRNSRVERYHYRFTNDCENPVQVRWTDNSTSANPREMRADGSGYRRLDHVILAPGDDRWTSVDFTGSDIGSGALGIDYCAQYVALSLREQPDCDVGDPPPGGGFIPMD